MRTQDIAYEADGRQMVGHLAVDDNQPGPRPAVLVCHEGPGLDNHAKGRAQRLAALGYIAFALDYHGGGAPVEQSEFMARIGEFRQDPDRIRAIGRAGLDVLLAQPEADPSRVAAIGYCFGGTLALELARDGADLKGVVGFHSGLATSSKAEPGAIRGPVLVCIGADDPIIPPEQRLEFEAEMREASVDWRMNLYGNAVHSFTAYRGDSPAPEGSPVAYHRPTDERSWRAMLELFTEIF